MGLGTAVLVVEFIPILGAVLLDSQQFDRAQTLLTHASFYAPRHQKIFRALEELVESGTAIDVITLKAELEKRIFADRAVHLGDPDFVDVPVGRLTSLDYAAALRKTIAPSRAEVRMRLAVLPPTTR